MHPAGFLWPQFATATQKWTGFQPFGALTKCLGLGLRTPTGTRGDHENLATRQRAVDAWVVRKALHFCWLLDCSVQKPTTKNYSYAVKFYPMVRSTSCRLTSPTAWSGQDCVSSSTGGISHKVRMSMCGTCCGMRGW